MNKFQLWLDSDICRVVLKVKVDHSRELNLNQSRSLNNLFLLKCGILLFNARFICASNYSKLLILSRWYLISLPDGMFFKVLLVFSILSLVEAAFTKISNSVCWWVQCAYTGFPSQATGEPEGSQAPWVSIETFSLKHSRTSSKVSESVKASLSDEQTNLFSPIRYVQSLWFHLLEAAHIIISFIYNWTGL